MILENYNARRFPNLMYQNREIHTKRKKRDKLRKRKIGICGELVCKFFFFQQKDKGSNKISLKKWAQIYNLVFLIFGGLLISTIMLEDFQI